MIISLENNMNNLGTRIMSYISKKIDYLKFQQKLLEERETLSIYCPKCRRNHIFLEFPLNVKSANKCVISTGKHHTPCFPVYNAPPYSYQNENYYQPW